MKRFSICVAIACWGVFALASAHAGAPTPDNNLVDFGSTNVSYLHPAGAAGTSGIPAINYDPFNSLNEGFTFDETWYATNYSMPDLQYGDGTVVAWQHDGALPIGFGGINAFDNGLTGHTGFATELMPTPVSGDNYATYYRIPINVGIATGPVLMEYVMDDGAAIYLDGEPWLRINCCDDPAGGVVAGIAPWFTTEAFNATGTEDDLRTVSLGGLPPGNRLLAISLHSNANTSSDTGMDFRIYTPGNYRPWGVNASGNWSTAANWQFDVAGSNEFAIFGSAISGSRTIFTDTSVSLDGIQFGQDIDGTASTGTYNIAGTGAINISGRSNADGSLNVFNGNHEFQVVVQLNKNTDADISANASIDFNNELNLNSRTLRKIGDGDLIVGNNETNGDGTIDVMAGVLGGGGSVGGNVQVNGGTIAPGGTVQALGSAATLTINGNANINSGGITLNVFGNGNADAIAGGGTGNLSFGAGTTVNINPVTPYTPADGHQIQVFPGWSAVSGFTAPPNWTFDAATGTLTFGEAPPELPCDLNADEVCDITDIDMLINDPNVTAQQIDDWLADAGPANGFSDAFLRGDANLDGTVDAQDLNRVGQNWLSSGTTWSSGDFNADDVTDAQDLNAVGQRWLSSVPPAAATAAVPEPTAAGLLLVGLLGLVRRRR